MLFEGAQYGDTQPWLFFNLQAETIGLYLGVQRGLDNGHGAPLGLHLSPTGPPVQGRQPRQGSLPPRKVEYFRHKSQGPRPLEWREKILHCLDVAVALGRMLGGRVDLFHSTAQWNSTLCSPPFLAGFPIACFLARTDCASSSN